MNWGAMLEWVEENLKLFIAIAPENVVSLFVLDFYQCHMIALVVSSIQQLGMEVKHIPGECTFVSLLMLELTGH